MYLIKNVMVMSAQIACDGNAEKRPQLLSPWTLKLLAMSVG
jgi:hypothetical protein